MVIDPTPSPLAVHIHGNVSLDSLLGLLPERLFSRKFGGKCDPLTVLHIHNETDQAFVTLELLDELPDAPGLVRPFQKSLNRLLECLGQDRRAKPQLLIQTFLFMFHLKIGEARHHNHRGYQK